MQINDERLPIYIPTKQAESGWGWDMGIIASSAKFTLIPKALVIKVNKILMQRLKVRVNVKNMNKHINFSK